MCARAHPLLANFSQPISSIIAQFFFVYAQLTYQQDMHFVFPSKSNYIFIFKESDPQRHLVLNECVILTLMSGKLLDRMENFWEDTLCCKSSSTAFCNQYFLWCDMIFLVMVDHGLDCILLVSGCFESTAHMIFVRCSTQVCSYWIWYFYFNLLEILVNPSKPGENV